MRFKLFAAAVLMVCAGWSQAQASPAALTKTAVAIFVSPGVSVDGGGFWIDAQGHIHRVPPRQPNVRELFALATLVDRAAGFADSGAWAAVRSTVEARTLALGADVVPQPGRGAAQAAVRKPHVPTLVAIYVSAGVKSDGSGFVILANGKVIRIPPRGPALEEIATVAAILQQLPGPALGPQPEPWRQAIAALETRLAAVIQTLPRELEAVAAQ